MFKNLVIVFCLLELFAAGAVNAEESRKVPGRHLHLLITSDIHGWLSTSLMHPGRKRKGLLHIEDHILSIRRRYPNAILIDGGDLLQGSPLVHYFNRVAGVRPAANPFFARFNRLKYDVAAVGNHDLELNPDFEEKYVPASSFHWISANLERDGRFVFKPYTVLVRNGLKIAVVGFTTPGILMWLGKEQINRMTVNAIEKTAETLIPDIYRKENPDIVIGVFHSGTRPTRDDENSKLNRIPSSSAARQCLLNTRGIHLAIVGHDHILYPYRSGMPLRRIGESIVIEGGAKGEALIRVAMEVEKKRHQSIIRKIRISVLKALQHASIDKTYSHLLSPDYKSYLAEQLPWSVGRASKKTVARCVNDLIAQSNEEGGISGTLFPEARISYVRDLQGRNLNRRDLFTWLPYDNRPVTVRLSKRQIRLLRSAQPNYGYRRVPYNRKLYTWLKKPLQKQEEWTWILNPDLFARSLKVKISDYHFHGGAGIAAGIFMDEDDLLASSEMFCRDILFSYLKNSQKLPPSCHFFVYSP